MTEEQISNGETSRSLARIERALEALSAEVRDRHRTLNDQMVAYIGPVAVLKQQAEDAKRKLEEHDSAIVNVRIQAGKVTLVGTAAAILAALVPWPWKH